MATLPGGRVVSATGPRRHGVAATAMLLVEHEPSGSDPHAAAGGAPAAVPLLQRGVVSVTAALHAVNLFARPVIVAEPAVVARGRRKTWLFAAAFGVLVLILVVLNLVQSTTVRYTLVQPSRAQYDGIADYAPVCECARTDTMVGSVASLAVPPWANYSVNACAALQRVMQMCLVPAEAPDGSGLVNRCLQTDAATLLWLPYMQSIAVACLDFAEHFDDFVAAALATPLGANLLPAAVLDATVTDAVLTLLRTFEQYAGSLYSPLAIIQMTGAAPMFELTVGARSRTPPNCTCAGDMMTSTPAVQANAPCRFQPAFDPRPTSNATASWLCNVAFGALYFPMHLLTLESTYAILALPPPYATYTTFSGAELYADANVTTSFGQFMNATLSALFATDASGLPTPVRLAPGLLTLSFDTHYTTCAPAACTYVYDGRLSPVAALTAVLGIVSGAQTVLMLVIDRGYDLVAAQCAACRRRRRGRGGDDDGDGDDDVSGVDGGMELLHGGGAGSASA